MEVWCWDKPDVGRMVIEVEGLKKIEQDRINDCHIGTGTRGQLLYIIE